MRAATAVVAAALTLLAYAATSVSAAPSFKNINWNENIPSGYRLLTCAEAQNYQAEIKKILGTYDICGLSGGSASGPGYSPLLICPDTRSFGCRIVTDLPLNTAPFLRIKYNDAIPSGYRLLSCYEAEHNQAEVKKVLGTWDICGVVGGSASGPGYSPLLYCPDPRSFDCRVVTRIPQTGSLHWIENNVTGRLVFDSGNNKVINQPGSLRGNEGGWSGAPKALATDANYNKLADWIITRAPGTATGVYFIQNSVTNRYLFDTGSNNVVDVNKRGKENGWYSAPIAVTADANYYNLAYWRFHKIAGHSHTYLIVNENTKRYLFDGQGISRPVNRNIRTGVEGGWTNAPTLLTSDSNYYNLAYWHIAGFTASHP